MLLQQLKRLQNVRQPNLQILFAGLEHSTFPVRVRNVVEGRPVRDAGRLRGKSGSNKRDRDEHDQTGEPSVREGTAAHLAGGRDGVEVALLSPGHCYGVVVWPLARSCRQLRIHRHVRFQQARDWTTCLGRVRRGGEFRRVNPGDFGRHIQMRFGDRPTGVRLVHRDRRRGVDGFRRDVRLAQFRRQSHRDRGASHRTCGFRRSHRRAARRRRSGRLCARTWRRSIRGPTEKRQAGD